MPTHPPPEPTPAPATPLAELAAMRVIVRALEPLDGDARARVVSWVADLYAADLSATLARYDEYRDAR